jgi:hypothetical protein
MSEIDKIKETITEAMMNARGWDEMSKINNPFEWDSNSKDSQYSLIKEDVDFIVNEAIEEITKIDVSDEDLEDYDYLALGDNETLAESTVTVSATSFIFMDAGIGNPAYISDVREWLKRVDQLGLPDDTEVEGTLHLAFDIYDPTIERIECGGCGEKDILLTVHECEETPKR